MNIQNVELKPSHIGRAVLYVPHRAAGDVNHSEVERGVIASFNDTYVFVRYEGDNFSAATLPSTLVWTVEPAAQNGGAA